jgi:[ribosomal protein S18]-alanine N-acetyltransferase
MSLRPAAESDIPRFADLHAACFESPWTAEALAATLAGAGVLALAAEADSDVSGFVISRVAAGEAEILTLAVDPAKRRQGLGAGLVTAVIEAGCEAGVEAVFLEVAIDNEAAIGLYETLGFERVGRRRGYYARPNGRRVDALTLRRDLTA